MKPSDEMTEVGFVILDGRGRLWDRHIYVRREEAENVAQAAGSVVQVVPVATYRCDEPDVQDVTRSTRVVFPQEGRQDARPLRTVTWTGRPSYAAVDPSQGRQRTFEPGPSEDDL